MLQNHQLKRSRKRKTNEGRVQVSQRLCHEITTWRSDAKKKTNKGRIQMLQRLGYKISKWNGNAEKKQATARRERKGNRRADNEIEKRRREVE